MLKPLDRTQVPQSSPLKNVKLPTYEQHELPNGISVYLLPFGNVEVSTLRCIFRGGKGHQPQTGVASYTTRNMSEGTRSYTGFELAKVLDRFGTWIGSQTGYEHISFDLSTLSKDLPATLPLLAEVLFSPRLAVEEFENMRQRNLQKLQVEAQKTRYHAQRLFGHELFGNKHPYGMHLGEDELNALRIEHIHTYHQANFFPGNFQITVVGSFDSHLILEELSKSFGQVPTKSPISSPSLAKMPISPSGHASVRKPLSGMQSTVRVGHLNFPRNHPDFYGMQIVNSILGGYFGSRLMQNIREDKGYTYGISSGWLSFAHNGFFVVQSDVGNEYVEDTILEIKKEIRILQNELVPEEELTLVKNYLQGRSLSERETLFQLSDLLRFSLVNDISFEELDRKFEVLREITSEDILSLAQTHLKPDEMLEVVVGGASK
ncbi:MAG: pitrilysin family protein [Bacteroidota bacterium]